MHLLTHAAISAALSLNVHNPVAAVILGLTSHVVLDAIPHRDAESPAEVAVDGVVSIALATWLISRAGIFGVIGAIAGSMPDAEIALTYLGYYPHSLLFPSHSGLLPHGNNSSWRAGMVEIILALGSLVYLVSAALPK